jgi:hypothetical protein
MVSSHPAEMAPIRALMILLFLLTGTPLHFESQHTLLHDVSRNDHQENPDLGEQFA